MIAGMKKHENIKYLAGYVFFDWVFVKVWVIEATRNSSLNLVTSFPSSQLRRLRDVKRHNSPNVAESDILKDVFNRMHSSDAFFRRSVKNHPIQSLPSAVTLERKCFALSQ